MISPQLTPFVRSDAVGAILAETLAHPDRELTLAELGRRTGVSGSVTHREIGRLVDSGILLDRHEGRNRLVRANQDHQLFSPMREIIMATYGPIPVLRHEFEGADGVEQVLIYGSWAARRTGEPGEFPQDIDVLVIGDVLRRRLADIASRSGDALDMPVNITRLSSDEWQEKGSSPFVDTVRSRPFVDVMTGQANG